MKASAGNATGDRVILFTLVDLLVQVIFFSMFAAVLFVRTHSFLPTDLQDKLRPLAKVAHGDLVPFLDSVSKLVPIDSIDKLNPVGTRDRGIRERLQALTELLHVMADKKLDPHRIKELAVMLAERERTAILENIRKDMKDSRVPIRIDTKAGVIRLPEAVLFESGEADIQGDGPHRAIAALGAALSRELHCRKQRDSSCRSTSLSLDSVFVEGHTDNVPINNGAFDDNWDLSVARAKSVYAELRRVHRELDRLENANGQRLFGLSGYGESRPIASNDTPAGKALNRRIDIRFVVAAPKT